MDNINYGLKLANDLTTTIFESERYKKVLWKTAKDIQKNIVTINNEHIYSLLDFLSHYLLTSVSNKEQKLQNSLIKMFDDLDFFEGYEIENKSNLKSQVDILIRDKEGNLVIVENKKGDINSSAVKQIQRYMDKENIKYGILTGKNLNVDLPSNIEFFNMNIIERNLEKLDYSRLLKIKDDKLKNMIIKNLLDKSIM